MLQAPSLGAGARPAASLDEARFISGRGGFDAASRRARQPSATARSWRWRSWRATRLRALDPRRSAKTDPPIDPPHRPPAISPDSTPRRPVSRSKAARRRARRHGTNPLAATGSGTGRRGGASGLSGLSASGGGTPRGEPPAQLGERAERSATNPPRWARGHAGRTSANSPVDRNYQASSRGGPQASDPRLGEGSGGVFGIALGSHAVFNCSSRPALQRARQRRPHGVAGQQAGRSLRRRCWRPWAARRGAWALPSREGAAFVLGWAGALDGPQRGRGAGRLRSGGTAWLERAGRRGLGQVRGVRGGVSEMACVRVARAGHLRAAGAGPWRRRNRAGSRASGQASRHLGRVGERLGGPAVQALGVGVAAEVERGLGEDAA